MRADLCASAWSPNLEIVLLGFASHDDVERLIRVFGAALNAAGHVLLILVRVQPYTERPGVSSQLGPWVRSLNRKLGDNVLQQQKH